VAEEEVEMCPDCKKYPIDSFACKIRHIQINSGAAKASRDSSPDFGLTEQQ
jgi:hypothetical protein